MDDKKLIDATGVVVETAGKVVAGTVVVAAGKLLKVLAEGMNKS